MWIIMLFKPLTVLMMMVRVITISTTHLLVCCSVTPFESLIIVSIRLLIWLGQLFYFLLV
uniref:Uncharacterized protein n=1 Tax=Beet necrotic yellow vein virus TaxID=31721 RepID=A0A247ZL28_9VIRU|nr:hypothetical protein [Beet necrotic yellow vein virus]UEV87745.1 N protein [Beet necrotic yellow vein virus]